MSIYTVNNRELFSPKPDFTITLGIPTFYALHQMQLELESNTLSVHSNLWGGNHWHLVLLMTNTKYATLLPVAYVRPLHPGIIQILSNATCVALYKLNRVYDDNLWVFHEVCGFKQALIQQVFTAVDEQYIISMKNRATRKFTGNIHHIVAYLLSTYRKISLSHWTISKKK